MVYVRYQDDAYDYVDEAMLRSRQDIKAFFRPSDAE
jgi:hypothetical protein